MRMLWKRIARAPQSGSDRMHFVMFDFLKMFAAAMLLGAAFSVLAASVVLMLSASRDANAGSWVERDGLMVSKHDVPAVKHDAQEMLQKLNLRADEVEEIIGPAVRADDVATDMTPTPGSLFLGDGCGSDLLPAIEREWVVTVDAKHIDVQVMQTFMLPSNEGAPRDDAIIARFYAQLPKGASYSHFRVDTESGVTLGPFSDDADWDSDDFKTANALATRGEIRVFAYQARGANTLSSDMVAGVRAGETVIVTYRYRMPLNVTTAPNTISRESIVSVALNEPRSDEDAFTPGGSAASRFGTTDFTHEPEEMTPTRPHTAGTVWVEWKAHAPTQITDMPRGSVIERAPTKDSAKAGRITGLSWTTPRLDHLDQFQLAWR
jgi:hypothetical protein